MSEKNTYHGFATGFVMGAIAGLAIGFLYAPQPGEETRQRLREEVRKVREQTAEIAEKVEKATAEAKRRAETKMKDIEEKMK